MRGARDRQWLARPPYLLWVALIAFVFGCWLLVRGQSAPTQRIEGLAPGDCWIRARGSKMFIGEPRCYRTLPQRRICGVWLPGFEQSLFFHDVSDLSGIPVVNVDDLPWLDIADGATGLPTTEEQVRRRAAYRICFLGRESDYYGSYGHMGMSRTGVLLEKTETVREIPIPKGLQLVSPGLTN